MRRSDTPRQARLRRQAAGVLIGVQPAMRTLNWSALRRRRRARVYFGGWIFWLVVGGFWLYWWLTVFTMWLIWASLVLAWVAAFYAVAALLLAVAWVTGRRAAGKPSS
ncbi:MAG TPA: hypothetical protein VMV09_05125 [Candidatus Saccharimonadales bacterium]|nr:hypothetical protein [Candidatus Saccharimonadales bacterium]